MKKRLLSVFVAVALGLTVAPSLAHGPSGSSEEVRKSKTTTTRKCKKTRSGRKCRTVRTTTYYTEHTNDVKCKGTRVGSLGTTVYVGANGVEGCNDGGPVPIQGRVMAVNKGADSSISADGDKHNSQEDARGWASVSRSGVRCGDKKGRMDSQHATSADAQADCQPGQ
jgi:hypothetical protein